MSSVPDLHELHDRLEVRGLLADAQGAKVHLCDVTTPRDREALAMHALSGWSEARAPAAWELVRALEQSWLPRGVIVGFGTGRWDNVRANSAMRRALSNLLKSGAVKRAWWGPRYPGCWRWTATITYAAWQSTPVTGTPQR